MTTYSRILDLLVRARKGRYRPKIGRDRVPDGGWLPMFEFRGPACGGDAAHVRLYEIGAPLGSCPGAKGIHIETMTTYYTGLDRQQHLVQLYRLAIKPHDIDCALDIPNCRLLPDITVRTGLRVSQSTEISGGKLRQMVRLTPATT